MSDAAPEIGTRFGPYLLRRLLGSGGMGRVYEAEDTAMDRIVALKLISSTYAQDPEYRKRLQREARIAGRLQDPHVVPIHGAGEIDGQLYVDMRLINGTDLESMLRHTGPLPPQRAVNITRQVASALDAAHAAGVMHRDVKPANILITADDFAYLVDFGIANAATEEKLTQMGDVLGTWAYMAPERFGNDSEVTPRSDVYALTCVLYEMLTGAAPFGGDRMSVIAAHLSHPIPRPSLGGRVPAALDAVITRGMAKDPANRYATAGELARAAESAAAAGPTSHAFGVTPTAPVPPGPTERIAPVYQSNPGMTASPGGQYPQQQWNTSYPQGSYPQGQPPAKSRKWIPIAIAAVVVVAVVAAVGIWRLTRDTGTDPGETASSVDLSTLDVGEYDTEPRELSGPVSEEDGRNLYAYEIAEGMPNPSDIDPALNFVYGVPASDPAYAATTISGTSTPITQPAMEKYGMVSGYVVTGYTVPVEDFLAGEQSDSVIAVLVTAYPNPDAAARAAKEIEGIDFDLNPDNRRIDVPGYPDALAHYRPGFTSIGATMASDYFVISIIYGSFVNASTENLVSTVQKTLDLQIPLLDKVFPIPAAALTSTSIDPDNMLSRALTVGAPPPVGLTYGPVGPVATYFACINDMEAKREILQDAGADRCGITPDSILVRTRDEESATTLAPLMVESERERFVKEEIAAPVGLPNTTCYEQKDDVWDESEDHHYYCYLAAGRYVAGVHSATEDDVRERAAAQYSIIVNSQ